MTRLLWGRTLPEAFVTFNRKQFITLFALFETIEFDELRSHNPEYHFLTLTTGVMAPHMVTDARSYFLERGILGLEHGYLVVQPKPLAIRLAADWFRERTAAEALLFIESIPLAMQERFAKQFALMHFLPNAQDVVAQLCCVGKVLGHLSILHTVHGAQLLSCSAEINPIAIANSLCAMLTVDNLPETCLPGLPILIHTLEKLCFRESTFQSAALSLAKIYNLISLVCEKALAEKYFLRLFQVRHTGTQTPLTQRIPILNTLLSEPNPAMKILAIKAIATALDTDNPPRSPRAEFQGSGKSLVDWAPTDINDPEVVNYQKNALDKLLEMSRQPNEFGFTAYQLLVERLEHFADADLSIGAIPLLLSILGLHKAYASQIHEKIMKLIKAKEAGVTSPHLRMLRQLEEAVRNSLPHNDETRPSSALSSLFPGNPAERGAKRPLEVSTREADVTAARAPPAPDPKRLK